MAVARSLGGIGGQTHTDGTDGQKLITTTSARAGVERANSEAETAKNHSSNATFGFGVGDISISEAPLQLTLIVCDYSTDIVCVLYSSQNHRLVIEISPNYLIFCPILKLYASLLMLLVTRDVMF